MNAWIHGYYSEERRARRAQTRSVVAKVNSFVEALHLITEHGERPEYVAMLDAAMLSPHEILRTARR